MAEKLNELMTNIPNNIILKNLFLIAYHPFPCNYVNYLLSITFDLFLQ